MTRRNLTVTVVDPTLGLAASVAAGQAEVAALIGMGAFSEPVPPARAKRGALFPTGAVVTAVVDNPKRAGSKEYAKFARIEIGMTEKQLRVIGYNTWDLNHLVGHDHIVVEVAH